MVDLSLSTVTPNGLEDPSFLPEVEEELDTEALLKMLGASSKQSMDGIAKEAFAHLARANKNPRSLKEALLEKAFWAKKFEGKSTSKATKTFQDKIGTKSKETHRAKQDLVKLKRERSFETSQQKAPAKKSASSALAPKKQTTPPKKGSTPSSPAATPNKSPAPKTPNPQPQSVAKPPTTKHTSSPKKTPQPNKQPSSSKAKKPLSQTQARPSSQKNTKKTTDKSTNPPLRQSNKEETAPQQAPVKERPYDKEEGRGGEHQQQEGQEQQEKKKKHKITKISRKEKIHATSQKTTTIADNTISTKTPLSTFRIQRAKMVSMASVMDLFFEILKLFITHREQSKTSRRLERNLQIAHKLQEVANLREQGKWLLYTGIGAGVLGIASGALPIIGVVKGEWLQQNLLGRLSSKLADMKTHKLFEGMSKMSQSMADTYKVTGQITTTYAEADRKWEEERNAIARTEGDEYTTELREKQDDWQSFLRFIQEVMQMDQDAIRQLYR